MAYVCSVMSGASAVDSKSGNDSIMEDGGSGTIIEVSSFTCLVIDAVDWDPM